jgi:5'-deoxynucleotidase YfbR-like HD superfamily hydrolase
MTPLMQVLAIREGGHVKRCHTFPIAGEYTVASHTFNAAALLVFLNPDCNMDMVKTILTHDVAERWTGDLPAPIKWYSEGLKEELNIIEDHINQTFGWHKKHIGDELAWIKGVDALEFMMFCMDQERLGNRNIESRLGAIAQYMVENSYMFPEPINTVVSQLLMQGMTQLPNNVGDLP